MKRAILVTAGTVTGLVSVLTYNPLTTATAVLAETPGGGTGLGGPPAATSTDPNTAAPSQTGGSAATDTQAPRATGAPTTTPAATASHAPSAHSTAHATKAPGSTPTSTSHAPAPTKAATKHAPAPTKAATTHAPAPSKSPSHPPSKSSTTTKAPPPATPHDYTGSAVTYKYGTLQVAIRVLSGKITDAWAVSYPTGTSQPYSEMSIPILRSQTISAQSAKIAGASGATLTSTSWIKSLSAALTQAGL